MTILCSRPAAAQRSEPPSFSRIALRINNLLIIGNRIDLAITCVVESPLTDKELVRRRLDPTQWRRNYCSQAVRIVEPWARQFRQHGNFQLLLRGAADAEFAKIRPGDEGYYAPDALQELGRKTQATHLLLIQEKITPHGNRLSEQRVLQLIDLSAGEVVAVDGAQS